MSSNRQWRTSGVASQTPGHQVHDPFAIEEDRTAHTGNDHYSGSLSSRDVRMPKIETVAVLEFSDDDEDEDDMPVAFRKGLNSRGSSDFGEHVHDAALSSARSSRGSFDDREPERAKHPIPKEMRPPAIRARELAKHGRLKTDLEDSKLSEEMPAAHEDSKSGSRTGNELAFHPTTTPALRSASQNMPVPTPTSFLRGSMTKSLGPIKRAHEFVRCQIVRNRSGSNRLYPLYLLYEETSRGALKLLMAAKKQTMNKTANYHMFNLIGADPKAKLSKHSERYIGKLRANADNTELVLLGKGCSLADYIKRTTEAERPRMLDALRPEMAALVFSTHSLKERLTADIGPRELSALLPPLRERDKDGLAGDVSPAQTLMNVGSETMGTSGWRQLEEDESLLALLKSGRTRGLPLLRTLRPQLKEGVYQLNFGGRVKVASVKNFQMARVDDDDERPVLQFGKTGDDSFILDYKPPITAAQAFAVALAQFNA